MLLVAFFQNFPCMYIKLLRNTYRVLHFIFAFLVWNLTSLKINKWAMHKANKKIYKRLIHIFLSKDSLKRLTWLYYKYDKIKNISFAWFSSMYYWYYLIKFISYVRSDCKKKSFLQCSTCSLSNAIVYSVQDAFKLKLHF
jgi:hypothetical protein